MTDFTSKRGDDCVAVPATATTLQVQIRQGQPTIDIPDIYAALARVTAERDEAVELLKELQWVHCRCPVCDEFLMHKPSCRIALFLAPFKEATDAMP